MDMCDYPGIAAVVSGDKNVVLCSGVTQAGNVLLIPELCRIAVTKQLTVRWAIILRFLLEGHWKRAECACLRERGRDLVEVIEKH